MTTLLDYAALSAIVYNDVRKEENVLSPLPGWTEVLSETGNLGFTATAYKNGNEIVIAFKGTDTTPANAAVDWLAGNLPSGLAIKGVSIAIDFTKPCHVAHALD